jgi:hypothetical protein
MQSFLYNAKRNVLALIALAVLLAFGANHAQALHLSHAKTPVVEVVELT